MKKSLAVLAAVLGVVFLGFSWIYWSTPASALPTYLPGYETGVMAVHFKHGLAALVLALGLFVFAWFESGAKK